MNDYHTNTFFRDDDRGYIADIADLPSCSAFEKTPIEALAEVEKAKRLWLKSADAQGKEIPKPNYRPALYQAASWDGRKFNETICSPNFKGECSPIVIFKTELFLLRHCVGFKISPYNIELYQTPCTQPLV